MRRPVSWTSRGLTAILFIAMFAFPARAQEYTDVFPETPDPFVGDWVGRVGGGEKVDPDLAAQVIALGNDRYRVQFMAKLDMRAPHKAVAEVTRTDDALEFTSGSYTATFRDGVCVGSRDRGKYPFELKKVTRVSPTLGAKPPSDAIVLFDGFGFDAWEGPSGWEIVDGALMVTPKGKDIATKQRFKDLKMHIEFRNSFMPAARGQQRSNSGVFVQDVYEAQVLDSYGLDGFYDECGALYKVAPPKVNACRPPLEWQTYDIEFRAARFRENGAVAEYPRMTVYHNGVLIHHDQELPQITAWTEAERLAPPPREPGRIRLQAHGNYVQFRNIWVVDLGG